MGALPRHRPKDTITTTDPDAKPRTPDDHVAALREPDRDDQATQQQQQEPASPAAYQDLPAAAAERLPAVQLTTIPARITVGDPGNGRHAGTSIADPTADDFVDTLLHQLTDPHLKHEMNWTRQVARSVAEIVVYHANNGPSDLPQLAPMELVMTLRDNVEQIVQARLAALKPQPPTDDPAATSSTGEGGEA